MKKKTLLTILAFGSLWGCIEVLSSVYLNFPNNSVIPTILGLAVLAAARFLVKTPGSSTAIGTVALLFRLITAGHYYCHIWAIFLIGASFDIVVSLLGSRWQKTKWQGLAGISSAYLTTTLFSITMTYIIQYEYWASVGLPKVLDYIAVNGSLIAVGALLFVPLGYKLGKPLMTLSNARPRPVFIGAVLLTLILWGVGVVF
jgi:hypothetical protein